jgi:hypothetical protein
VASSARPGGLELLTHHSHTAATIGQVGLQKLSDSRVDLSIHSQRCLLCQPCGGGSFVYESAAATRRSTRSPVSDLQPTPHALHHMKREAVFSVLHCLAPSYDTFLAP